jgi:hypothetical protein
VDRKRGLLLFPLIFVLAAIEIPLMILVGVLVYKLLVSNLSIPKWFWAAITPVGFALVAAMIMLPLTVVRNWFAPPAVEIWSWGGELVFKFKDVRYARDFEALNAPCGKGDTVDNRAEAAAAADRPPD